MGEMADYLLDSVDLWEFYSDSEYQPHHHDEYPPQPKRCIYCGQGGLWWAKAGDESKGSYYILVDRFNSPHKCYERKLAQAKRVFKDK